MRNDGRPLIKDIHFCSQTMHSNRRICREFHAVCDYIIGMSEEWMVRVEGKEYGPVDLDELREWKREGRLIRENEVREPGE